MSARSKTRQTFDDWAGKIAAKLLDRMQQLVAAKLSEKMLDAYKLGRRDERKQIATYLDAYGDLGNAIRDLAHKQDVPEETEGAEPPCCEHAKDYCEHGVSKYRQCEACINADMAAQARYQGLRGQS